MTPYEFGLIIEAYAERKKEEQEDKIALAYMTARWTAQWFSKRKPKPLNEIISIKKEKKQMTDDQMLETAKALNKLFGGEVVT